MRPIMFPVVTWYAPATHHCPCTWQWGRLYNADIPVSRLLLLQLDWFKWLSFNNTCNNDPALTRSVYLPIFVCVSLLKGFRYLYAAKMAFALLPGFLQDFWNLDTVFSSNLATRALVRSALWCWTIRPDSQSLFQYIPKLFDGIYFRAVRRIRAMVWLGVSFRVEVDYIIVSAVELLVFTKSCT